MAGFETLQVERDSQGVLRVTVNRPDIRNAFNATMIAELGQVFNGIAREEATRVVVLRGEGKVFCAGGDLNWMRASIDYTAEENLKDTRILTRMFQDMNECPKPVIGAVHGAAIGGGVGLVSVCDIVIATEPTVFSLSEVRLGVVPACIGPFVISKIGATHARALFVSAERFKSAKAKEIGLIHESVPDEAALDARVQELLGNLLQCGPNAVAVAKGLVHGLAWPEARAGQSDPYEYAAKTLADLRITDEAQEGIRAFLEKRKPSWSRA